MFGGPAWCRNRSLWSLMYQSMRVWSIVRCRRILWYLLPGCEGPLVRIPSARLCSPSSVVGHSLYLADPTRAVGIVLIPGATPQVLEGHLPDSILVKQDSLTSQATADNTITLMVPVVGSENTSSSSSNSGCMHVCVGVRWVCSHCYYYYC